MKVKSRKTALVLSSLSLLLCFAMLIGSTFAWFTDTASTGVSTITSGNLHVEIQNEAGNEIENLEWVAADGRAQNEILWEPGATYTLTPFKIVNTGNLALKYKLVVTGLDGDSELLKVIKFTAKKGSADADLEDLDGVLLPDGKTPAEAGEEVGQTKLITISAHMDENAGNEYQGLSLDGISITVYATQYTYENDSKDNTYDDSATYYPVIDAAGLKDALATGGNIDVKNDLNTVQTMVAKKATTINMNGKTIANENDIWDDTNWSLISAQEGAELTITGNGTFQAKENDCYAVDVQDGAIVTIEDGTFIGNIHAVYVLEGTAYINGGFFSVQQKYPQAGKENEFVLNCLDENRENGTAKIIVTGGTFVNFNPADCYAEGAHTNFVADGYSVIPEVQANGDTWYTVVKGTGAVVGTQEEMNTAISNNSTVTVKLDSAGTYTLPALDNKDVTITGNKDTVIDMTNKTNKAQSVSFEGVTVNFGTNDYCGFQHTGKLTYKDCTITGKQFLYGNEVEFNNCVFEQDIVDYNVWTYGAGHVLFNNCTFNCAGKSVLIYNEGSISGQTVEFQNCKFNASAPATGKAAIEIDSSLLKNGATYKVIIDKATADSVTGFGVGTNSGNSIWNNKLGTAATVVVDGKTVLSAS